MKMRVNMRVKNERENKDEDGGKYEAENGVK